MGYNSATTAADAPCAICTGNPSLSVKLALSNTSFDRLARAAAIALDAEDQGVNSDGDVSGFVGDRKEASTPVAGDRNAGEPEGATVTGSPHAHVGSRKHDALKIQYQQEQHLKLKQRLSATKRQRRAPVNSCYA